MQNKAFYAIGIGTIVLALTQFDCERNIKRKYPAVELSVGSIDASVAEYESEHGSTPESLKTKVLRRYCVDTAFESLNSVPVVDGETFEGYSAHACGRNFLMNCGQTLLGYGWGMKTVVDVKKLSERNLLHEVVHHASAFGLIDYSEFANAWEKMSVDEKYSSITKSIDDDIDVNYPKYFIDVIPKWRSLERESKLAEKMVFDKIQVPDCMGDVYKNVLKLN